MGVAEAGIKVDVSDTGIMVFVGRGAGLVGGTTVTDRSHARATTMNTERNKKAFFMGESPFILNHTHRE
jgi:hypothetical protein